MQFKKLAIKNFRCFEDIAIDFAPITILTGANSSGKSTLINSILSMLQTEQFPFYLSPNGDYVNMGSFKEMVTAGDVENNFSFELSFINPVSHDYSKFSKINSSWEINNINGLPKLKSLHCLFDDLHYLNTTWCLKINKLADTDYLLDLSLIMNNISVDEVESLLKSIPELNGFVRERANSWNNNIVIEKHFSSLDDLLSVVSNRDFMFTNYFKRQFNESLFNYIGSFRQPPNRSNPRHSKARKRVLNDGLGYLDQIIEWEETAPEKIQELNKILSDLNLLESIDTERVNGNTAFDVGVKVKNHSKRTNLADVGFGVSQFLPVIVADLQLPGGTCLAVSQPELHLHPKIQAQYGDYLCGQIKSKSKQYIIETHSEYFLNRIRLLLVQGVLKQEDLKVYYFENDGLRSNRHTIEFCTDGQIKGAPESFFDTYGIDVLGIALYASEL